jgi:hypothetical protein
MAHTCYHACANDCLIVLILRAPYGGAVENFICCFRLRTRKREQLPTSLFYVAHFAGDVAAWRRPTLTLSSRNASISKGVNLREALDRDAPFCFSHRAIGQNVSGNGRRFS